MPLDTHQRTVLLQQVEQMKTDGLFPPDQRSLTDNTRYLILGCGGIGAAALFDVKKQFETVLPSEQLQERVRFLVVDSDRSTQKSVKPVQKPGGTTEIVEMDSLTNDQFIHLPGDAARMCLHGDATVTQWINPQLRENLLTIPHMLDGFGASGIRQVGRLLLYPGSTVTTVTGKIQKLVHELTDANAFDLCVMILAGISGGTGSSLVIDLTYLIRSILESMPGNLDSPAKHIPVRTKYCGFILLPPTGVSHDPLSIRRGNTNGYAAMKEINHFMNIDARSGKYRMTYGDGRTVSSGKNIFDACYLLDGSSGDVISADPRGDAIHALSTSILDMVTASAHPHMGGSIPFVDFFMNDQAFARTNRISVEPVERAIRDADYNYCTLGCSEFSMPIHEIKAYVAKQMFDRIYDMLRHCSHVDEEEAKALLKTVLCTGAKTKHSASRSIIAETKHRFTTISNRMGGPFYVVNLLRALIDEVHFQREKLKLFRPHMATDDELDNIESCAVYLNNTTFQVFTIAVEALKDILRAQFGTVIRTERGQNRYTFMPMSMGSLEHTQHVTSYLDGLITHANLRNLTTAMLQEMVHNHDKWTALVRSEDPTLAPAAMRKFWNDQLDRIVSATLEDFLIKYYSGDPNAHYSAENHDNTCHFLHLAAQEICKQMLDPHTSCQPHVRLTGSGPQPEYLVVHTFLVVPESAPHLYRELNNIITAGSFGQNIQILTGTASDRISCYRQYAGIPAFKLGWVCHAEQDYEQSIQFNNSVGLHLCDVEGGIQWKNLPNLLPVSTWKMLPVPDYRNLREYTLAMHAEELFRWADQLKLTHSFAPWGIREYSVNILPPQFRPQDQLIFKLYSCNPASDSWQSALSRIEQAAEHCAEELLAQVPELAAADIDTVRQTLVNAGIPFQSRDLFFPGTVLNVGPGEPIPDNWSEHMAACMLRKLPDVMIEVKGTVMVMEKLMEKIYRCHN